MLPHEETIARASLDYFFSLATGTAKTDPSSHARTPKPLPPLTLSLFMSRVRTADDVDISSMSFSRFPPYDLY